ncbi:hypothetical protein PHISP_04962, partial [Aspergillus sp. HF37]
MFDRRCNIERRHANTCEWILGLDEYKNWRSQSRGLLWIKGKPGAGKSTLMAFLYDRLKEQHCTERGIGLEFFFTARGTEMQRTPLGMFRALLNQLLRKDPAVCSNVREVYKEKCSAFGHSERSREWQQRELEQLLQDAIIASAKRQQVTIFVDALDETGQKFASELAKYFHKVNYRAAQEDAAAKICISCRHYPIPTSVPGIEVWVENHNSDDIATFVHHNFHPENLLAGDSPDREAWQDLKEDLIQRANGVFQWAHVVVPLVEQKFARSESPEDVRRWLQQVPDEIGSVYQYILENVIEQEGLSRSFLLFQWVCLAERPLSVTEMRHALAAKDTLAAPYQIQCHETPNFVKSDDRMKQYVVALSGGLTEVVKSQDGNKEIVQVVHQSVNDFLRGQGLSLLATLEKDGKVSMCGTSRVGSKGNDI